MARLHEYEGKALLKERGVKVPRGGVAETVEQAERIARDIGGPVVMKIQAWTTGRAAIGGVKFADTPEEAAGYARDLLTMKVGNFPVEQVLIEEKIDIREELFVSLSIDDTAKQPVVLLSLSGGSGIEERAGEVHKIAVSVADGVDSAALDKALDGTSFDDSVKGGIRDVVNKVFETAKGIEARSVEINPVVVTNDGEVMAADCRMTVDDYAVFRHPELGIEIARELDHPPTPLERIAYAIEQGDHRGTFYFAQLPHEVGDEKLIGFHGAGGGGSMMSMDAATQEGFTLANFCDTSGNPSAAKVYAAARIILAQPGLVGYFGSGSGVASQEQFWSAYGLAKAFIETSLSIPAVIRLGGNSEDRAVRILEEACEHLPATVEGYKKDDTPSYCAERFGTLVGASRERMDDWTRTVPAFVGSDEAMSFPIEIGRVWIDTAGMDEETARLVAGNSFGLLEADGSGVKLAVGVEEVAKKDSELIACEVECAMAGRPVVFVDIPVAGLDAEGEEG